MKPYKGVSMEGPIATWYARITRGERGYAQIADALAAQLAPGARVLEVAPGPGYLAIELARRGLRVSAIDISRSFVAMCAENARAAGVEVDVALGDASHLSHADASFDLVVCRAAFKNFTDPLGALDEAYRVLAPGGRAVIYDLRKEASRDEIEEEIRGMHLSWLSTLWTRWTFRSLLLKRAFTEAALQDLIRRSRFGRGEIRHDGIGFELRLVRPAG